MPNPAFGQMGPPPFIKLLNSATYPCQGSLATCRVAAVRCGEPGVVQRCFDYHRGDRRSVHKGCSCCPLSEKRDGQDGQSGQRSHATPTIFCEEQLLSTVSAFTARSVASLLREAKKDRCLMALGSERDAKRGRCVRERGGWQE